MAYPTYISLNIYRVATNGFKTIKDGNTLYESASNEYTGTSVADLIDIKTGNGANIHAKVPYSVITYIDEVDETEETFTSAVQAVIRLKQVGFFVDSSGEGSGGVTTFKALTDNSVNNFSGRNGQIIYINGSVLDSRPAGDSVQNITDLQDWFGGELQDGKYIIASINPETGLVGVNQADIDTIINTPIPVDTFRIIAKGCQFVGGVWVANVQEFIKEVGDWCSGVSSVDGRLYRDMEYLGGDETMLSSYRIDEYKNPSASI